MSDVQTVSTQPQRRVIRRDIQGLRAIAVVLVILAHADVPGLGGGFQGVDIFFVISGYVITQNLLRHEGGSLGGSLLSFYSRRVRRIVPAATLVLVVTVIAAYTLLGSNFDPSLLSDARWATLFSANFRFISTNSGYLVQGVQPSLLLHYWSLAVEEQFYFVWPLVLFVTSRLAGARRIPALRVVLMLGIAASAIWAVHANSVDALTAYYSPFARAYELGLGALCAVLPTTFAGLHADRRRQLAWAAAASMLLSVGVLRTSTNFPGIAAWWPCLSAMALLWCGATPETDPSGPGQWLARPVLTWIGDRSYSLYLWHFVWLYLPLQFATPVTGWFARSIEILGATVCAAMSYRWLENPVRTSRRLARDPWAVALLLGCCVFAVWDVTEIVGHLAGVG